MDILFISHWEKPEFSGARCVAGDYTIWNVPRFDVIAAIVILFVVALGMMQDDTEALTCVYPADNAPLPALCVANVAWWINSHFNASLFLTTVACAMATTDNGQSV